MDDYFDVPVEKDPRLEDMVEQMKIGIATRDETIERLRIIIDDQEEKISDKDKAIKENRRLLLHFTLASVFIGIFFVVWAVWHCMTVLQ